VIARLIASIYARSGSNFFLRVIHVSNTVLRFSGRLSAMYLSFVPLVRGCKDMVKRLSHRTQVS
jgi:hypothetical protein